MNITREPKILFLDIETFPNKGYTWGKWEQNILEFMDHWYVLCVGYKWQKKKTKVVALPDFKGYKPFTKDEKLIPFVWDLLDKADIVIAQNGDEFDIKRLNTRFIYYGINPPSPYRTIDTLKIARSRFSFNSNKLDDIGRDLNIGRKVEHPGFPLWLRCEKGDMKAWRLMKKYNKQDVNLLEKLYLKERAWIKNHPNLDVFSLDAVCPRCGSTQLQRRGVNISQAFIYQRYQCRDCGGWFQRRKNEFSNSNIKPI